MSQTVRHSMPQRRISFLLFVGEATGIIGSRLSLEHQAQRATTMMVPCISWAWYVQMYAYAPGWSKVIAPDCPGGRFRKGNFPPLTLTECVKWSLLRQVTVV